MTKNYYLPKTNGELERISVPTHFKERLQERFPNTDIEILLSKLSIVDRDTENHFFIRRFKNSKVKLYINRELNALVIFRKLKFRPTIKYPTKPIWWNNLVGKTCYKINF